MQIWHDSQRFRMSEMLPFPEEPGCGWLQCGGAGGDDQAQGPGLGRLVRRHPDHLGYRWEPRPRRTVLAKFLGHQRPRKSDGR